MATTARARPLIGSKIGNYTVLETLGEGGMGTVYLAEHPMIGKRVAIKVLHADHAARADAMARCFLEARAVNEIHHANVVDVIDCGTAEVEGHGKVHYLLMEHLEGQPLRSVIRAGALGPGDAIAIALEVGRALEAAHAKGIIHRDIKPENIFVLRSDGDSPRVKVLDFGIAKLTEGHPFAERLTQSGVALGTPQYMAPEQLDAEDIDGRVDVYALGIVLYEMLCGAAPFSDETTARGVWRRMNELPTFPAQVAGTLPAGLGDLVMRAIDPDRIRRPSMSQLVAGLLDPAHALPAGSETGPQTRRIGKGNPIPRPSTVPTLAPTQVDPKPRWWIGAAFIAVVGAGVAIAFVIRASSDPPERPPAPEPAPVTPAPSPPAPAPAPIATVAIEVVSVPAGADVYVAAETAPRGTTPTKVELARDTPPIELRIVRAGFVELRRSVPTHHDDRIQVELAEVPTGKPPVRPPVRVKQRDTTPATAPPDAGAPVVTPPDAALGQDNNLLRPGDGKKPSPW